MKRILVPTDFSDGSLLAMGFAANLARKTSGEIYLLHVVPNEDDYSNFNASGEWGSYVATETVEIPTMIGLLKVTAARMRQVKRQPMFDGITVFDNVEVGEPAIHINAAAEKYKADIIIMGTHGEKGFTEVLVGSTAEKVVNNANRPVITIREKCNIEPEKIVFATDFSEEAAQLFTFIWDFARIYNSTIHLLTVSTKDDFVPHIRIKRRFNQFRKIFGDIIYPFSIYNDISKEAGILHFAKDINADMIAVGSHERKGLARFFNSSISEELVNHSFSPVLTVNIRKGK